MPQNTEENGAITTLWGIPLDVIKQGGTVVILLVLMYFGYQAYTSKDAAYITLAQGVATQNTTLQTLQVKIENLDTQITNLRIQFAKSGLDGETPVSSQP